MLERLLADARCILVRPEFGDAIGEIGKQVPAMMIKRAASME